MKGKLRFNDLEVAEALRDGHLVWTHEERAEIAEIAATHAPYTPTYAPSEIELVREATTRERVRRRWRLAHKLTIAILAGIP